MPIPIKNGLSYPKTKIIYGDTRNKIQNQSSIPPIDFHAKTGLAVEYSISGNMQQIGQPTPDEPIIPEECGDRTANLCLTTQSNSIYYGSLNNYTISNNTISVTGQTLVGLICKCEPNTQYTVSASSTSGSVLRIREYSSFPTEWMKDFIVQSVAENFGGAGRISADFITNSETLYVLVTFYTPAYDAPTLFTDIMLNLGGTALPYVPFGYEITITL